MIKILIDDTFWSSDLNLTKIDNQFWTAWNPNRRRLNSQAPIT